MRKIIFLFFVLITSYAHSQEPNYLENEVLVQLKRDITPSVFESELSTVNIEESELISRPLNIWRIYLTPSAMTEDDAIQEFYTNDHVLVAQKNRKVTLRATTPNDPLFTNQWQYYQENDLDIDADEAWDITTGGSTINGDEIVVAVVDNGYNIDHPDLVDNLWKNFGEIPDNGIDDDANGYVDDVNGWNAYGNTAIIPVANHGTAVYGIVGAKGNNEIGVTGVNWDVKVMPIAGSSGNEATVIAAYSYALESRMLYNSTGGAEGSFVVATNASFGVDFGDPANYPLWCTMYDTLGENGILSCGATINGNYDVDIIGDVPTACPSEFLISVTNTNINDVKVTGAGYGAETIDLGAPGQGAYTVSTNSYGGFGGTSGATPHVTGTIALLYSAECQTLADMALSEPAEAARMVRDYILNGVDPNASLEGITTTGGRLNVNNALQALVDECEILSRGDVQGLDSFKVYPNPGTDIVYIQHDEGIKVSNLIIYGMDGRIVKEFDAVTDNQIDISELTSGMYVLRASFEGDTAQYTIMLAKE